MRASCRVSLWAILRPQQRHARGAPFCLPWLLCRTKGTHGRDKGTVRREAGEDRVPDPEEIGIHALRGDGDFRSAECVALLKKADVVVTNAPFSLFREYVAQLVRHGKKFLIIGNVNALTYKEIFPLRLWLGASIHGGDRKFGVPEDYPLEAATCGVDEKGQRFIRFKGVRWFTNLDYRQRHEDLVLYETYSPEKYPRCWTGSSGRSPSASTSPTSSSSTGTARCSATAT